MRKKILIADDDRSILEVLKIVLDRAGYRTEALLNGKKLFNNPPTESDLILLDIRMSGVDGLIICRHLKSMESTREIPIVMISAVPDLENLAKEAGADGFLEKPFNMKQLLEMVKKYTDDLDGYQSHEQEKTNGNS